MLFHLSATIPHSVTNCAFFRRWKAQFVTVGIIQIRRFGKLSSEVRHFCQFDITVQFGNVPRLFAFRHFAWAKRYFGLETARWKGLFAAYQYTALVYCVMLGVALTAHRFQRPKLAGTRMRCLPFMPLLELPNPLYPTTIRHALSVRKLSSQNGAYPARDLLSVLPNIGSKRTRLRIIQTQPGCGGRGSVL